MGSEERERLAEEKADRFAELQRYAFIAGFMDGGEVGTDAQAPDATLQQRYDIMEKGVASIMTTIMPFLPPSQSSAGWYAPAAVDCAVAVLKGQVQAATKHGERQVSNLSDRIAALEKSRDESNEAWDQAWQLLIKFPGTTHEGDFVTEFRKTVINFQDWRDELRAKWEAHGWDFLLQIVPNLDRSQDFFDAMQTVVKEVEGWEEDRIALRRANAECEERLQETFGLRDSLEHSARLATQAIDTYAEEMDSALGLLEPNVAHDHNMTRGYWLNSAIKARLHEIDVLHHDLAAMTAKAQAGERGANALALELDERNKEVACLKQDLRQSDKDLKSFVAKAEEKQHENGNLMADIEDRVAEDRRIRVLCRDMCHVEAAHKSLEDVVSQSIHSLASQLGPAVRRENDVPPERCIMAANSRVGGTHSREHRATATCNSIGCEPAARPGACPDCGSPERSGSPKSKPE